MTWFTACSTCMSICIDLACEFCAMLVYTGSAYVHIPISGFLISPHTSIMFNRNRIAYRPTHTTFCICFTYRRYSIWYIDISLSLFNVNIKFIRRKVQKIKWNAIDWCNRKLSAATRITYLTITMIGRLSCIIYSTNMINVLLVFVTQWRRWNCV